MRRFIVLLTIASALLVPSLPVMAGGGGCSRGLIDATANTIDLTANCFTPSVARIAVGDTVTWTNTDGWTHNVYANGFPNSPQLYAGAEYSHRFDKAGVFPYVCTLHPGMMGAIVVGELAGTSNPQPDETDAASLGFTGDSTLPPTDTAAIAAPDATEGEPDVTLPLALAAAALGVGVLFGIAIRRNRAAVRRPATT